MKKPSRNAFGRCVFDTGKHLLEKNEQEKATASQNRPEKVSHSPIVFFVVIPVSSAAFDYALVEAVIQACHPLYVS